MKSIAKAITNADGIDYQMKQDELLKEILFLRKYTPLNPQRENMTGENRFVEQTFDRLKGGNGNG